MPILIEDKTGSGTGGFIASYFEFYYYIIRLGFLLFLLLLYSQTLHFFRELYFKMSLLMPDFCQELCSQEQVESSFHRFNFVMLTELYLKPV